jgi:hypothetical protein
LSSEEFNKQLREREVACERGRRNSGVLEEIEEGNMIAEQKDGS